MKKIVIFLLILAGMMAGISSCHSSKETSTLSTNDSTAVALAKTAIEMQSFAFKANQIVLSLFPYPHVDPTSNYILVDGKQGWIQVSSESGFNAPFQINFNGNVNNYSYKYDKKGKCTIRFRLMMEQGSFDVDITMQNGSNKATAVFRNSQTGGTVDMIGEITPIDSSLYKAKSVN